ncbi:TlpA family protein disulfide reductase [Salinibacterium hongtaonis]|uniref:TlpA family protein disulfide reductase n=1 Tax=Homoserinimonas hongtaonis TaxID=2079791 RepID=A0A2U1T2A9_9MICO|nr:TlpA disulfide reductase family protein [Salinibacterium hongtaonis]AWB88256.1 alkyl hydroperoxide reductase [Salinibacterium hongtaonis]PWB98005.1 TlpA family protein disulfide reductase [Salinibacterium hongtaonis]
MTVNRRSSLRSVITIAAVAAIALTGCTSDPLAAKYGNGGTTNYTSSDGTVTEVPAENRADPMEFEGVTDGGIDISSADYAGDVVVVNFWYANCAPCRAEAPDLQEISARYADKGVSFVGVNIRDQPETALAFARKYSITYPSIIDAESGAARLAFAGHVPPSAVPTTIVLDKQGRVAARFLGQITSPSNLDTVIRDLLAEGA